MRSLASWLWRLPVRVRRLLFFTAVGLWVGLVVLGFSGRLFRGPADGLTSAVCALFVLLAVFAAVAWVLRLLGSLVSGRVPEETENTVGIPTIRTAFVMPIYHADVARVALGIAALAIQAPSYLAFCGPVMGVWVLSIPMAVGTSRVGLADRLARRGWMSALFSEEEALALGPLILEADATHLSPRSTAGVAAGPIENKRTWVAEPASVEISLGQTRLRIPWLRNASTRAAEVTRSLISAQGLLLAIGILLLLVVAVVRLGFAS